MSTPEPPSQGTETRPFPTGLPDDSMTSMGTFATIPSAQVRRGDGSVAPVTPGTEEVTSGGRYRLLRSIGAGGMGEVWESRQVELGRRVAVKRIHPDVFERSAPESWKFVRAQFESEAYIAALLEHPNIVPVHDLAKDGDGHPSIAMKLVQGENWGDVLKEDFRTKTETEIIARHLPILIDLAQAVAFAHHRGVIHRDLKPSQVMLGEFGEVLLMDWGLAFMDDATPREDWIDLPVRSTASNPAGTPAFMAPEQTELTPQNLGTWTDVYLLGATLYFILTGSPIHRSKDSSKAFEEAIQGIVEAPEERAPDRFIPEELSQLCMKALEVEPVRRVPSATLFVKALQDYITGEGNKNKSRTLTDVAREMLVLGKPAYELFSLVDSRLEEAGRLWPDNPELRAIREDCARGHATFALEHGDHGLARLHARRLVSTDSRDAVLNEISRREKLQARQARQRRMALNGVVVLLAILAASAMVFGAVLRKRAESIRQREESAQELVGFLTERLGREMDLSSEANRKILRQIAERVVKSFEAIDVSSESTETRSRFLQRLLETARTFVNFEELDLAEGLQAQALAIARESDGKDSVAYSRALTVGGVIKGARFQGAEGLKDFDEAIAILRHDNQTNTVGYANTLGDRAVLLMQMKRFSEAEEGFRQSVAIIEAQPQGNESALSTAYNNLSGILAQNGDFEKAIEYNRKSLALERVINDRNSYDTLVAEANLASILIESGDFEEGKAAMDRAIKGLQKIVPKYSQLVATYLQPLAKAQLGMGDFDGALASIDEAIQINTELHGLAGNGGLRVPLEFKADILGRAGRWEEVLSTLELQRTTLPSEVAKEPQWWLAWMFATVKAEGRLARWADVKKTVIESDATIATLGEEETFWKSELYMRTSSALMEAGHSVESAHWREAAVSLRVAAKGEDEVLDSANLQKTWSGLLVSAISASKGEERRHFQELLLAIVDRAKPEVVFSEPVLEAHQTAVNEAADTWRGRKLPEMLGAPPREMPLLPSDIAPRSK